MTKSALLRHPLTVVGALMATVCAVTFAALMIALLTGLFHRNPYAGLVVFVAIPGLFFFGLLLMPLGMWLQRRRLLRHPESEADWPILDFRRPEVRRRALLFTALTAVNVVILLLAGYSSLHWMESPPFCGQVCHTPMTPQFTAWQAAPHRQVACVDCHIGEGVKGFVYAKANGTRQLLHVATGAFPRPIPPGAEMPLGTQALTCQGCHSPGRIVGDRLRVIREYADDEASTETVTAAPVARGEAVVVRPRDPLARRSEYARRVRGHRPRAADDSLREDDRRPRRGEGVQDRGRRPIS